jgi:hypothetical protein
VSRASFFVAAKFLIFGHKEEVKALRIHSYVLVSSMDFHLSYEKEHFIPREQGKQSDKI